MSKISIIAAILMIGMAPITANAWKVAADFNTGELGGKADVGTDGFMNAGGASIYTDEKRLKKNAVKVQIRKGETGYGSWGGALSYPKTYKGETIWFLVHTHMPKEFDHYAYGAGGRLKFLRLQTLTAGGENIGYNDLYFDRKDAANPFAYIYEGEGKWVTIGDKDDYPVKDKWESYEMAVTLDNVPYSEGGKARVRIWKNGELLKDITDRKTLKHADAYSDRALIFTYWNGGSPKDQHMYVDEVTVTNERPDAKDRDGFPYLGGLIKRRPVMNVE